MARKDRKPKQFLDSKDEALKLAQSVAATQEDVSRQRIERRLQQADAAPATQKKHKSRDKLKQVKAALASEAAKVKRDKVKQRKRGKAGGQEASVDGESSQCRTSKAQAEPSAKVRKRVTFAD